MWWTRAQRASTLLIMAAFLTLSNLKASPQNILPAAGCEMAKLVGSTARGRMLLVSAFGDVDAIDWTNAFQGDGYCPVDKVSQRGRDFVCEIRNFIPRAAGDKICEYARRVATSEQQLEELRSLIAMIAKNTRDLANANDALTKRLDDIKEPSPTKD
jgi:hypothetical protein